MNTRKLMGIRKWLSLVGILSILSSLMLSIPMASAEYSGEDAPYEKDAVQQACDREIIDCSLDADFTSSVNRATGFTMLTRGIYESDTARSPFADIKADDWFAAAAHTAYTLGWTDNTKVNFDAGGKFTREQIAVVGARVLGLEKGTIADLVAYSDKGKVSSWAVGEMAAMVKAELMGVNTTKLSPTDTVNKLDGIIILNRIASYVEDNEVDVLEVAATKLGTDVETLSAAIEAGEGINAETGEQEAYISIPADENVATGEEEEEGEEEEGEEEEGDVVPGEEEVVVPPATTAVTVTLGANSPIGGTLVQGQATAHLADFTFANNGAAELKVTKVDLTRIGVSADTTLPRVYLYDGSKRLTEDASVSTGVISWTNSEGIFTVAAGASKTISVKANIAATTSGQTVGVKLDAATGITANATVTGTFPVSGAVMTIATATLAGFDFSAATQPVAANNALDPQTDFIAWQNTVSIGTRSVNLHYLNFRVIGSIALTDINNFRLLIDGAPVGTAVANADSNGYVLFDMSAAPKKVDTGSRIFKVLADVVGGSTRTFQLALRQTADVKVVDTEYNVDILATVASATFTVLQPGLQTVSTGTLTITRDTTSPTGNVVLNGTGITLGAFELKALGEKMKVENLRVAVDSSSADTDIHLRNGALYVYDKAAAATTAIQVGSTAVLKDINNSVLAYTEYSLGSSLIVEPGKPKILLIKADIYDSGNTTSILAAAQTLIARVAVGSTNVQAMTSAGYSSVPAAIVVGNTLSIVVGTVALTKDQSYGSQNAVVPQSNYKMAQYVLTNGSNEDVNLDTFTVTLTASAVFEVGDLTSLYIKYGDKSTPPKATGQATQSWSINQTLTKSQSITVQVFADIASGAVLTGTGDTMLTNLLVSGTTANSGAAVYTGAGATGTALAGQTITAKTSGTLNVSVDQTIIASQVIAGTTPDTGALKLKLAATNEDLYVKSLTFRTDATASDVAVASATLFQSQGGTAYTQVGGVQTLDLDTTNPGFVTWTLSGTDRVKVSKSGTTYLLLKPTYVSSGQDLAALNTSPSFNLADLTAEGVTTITPSFATGLTVNGGIVPAALTGLFAADGTAIAGTTTSATTQTVTTTGTVLTTARTGQYILFDNNSDATYTAGTDEIGYVMLGAAGSATLTVQRGVFGTTAVAATTKPIYFLTGLTGVTNTVLNTKLTITPNALTPQGASLSPGAAQLLMKFDVAATTNNDPPSGISVATLTTVNITTTKSGMTVNDLLIYPSESGYDNVVTYKTTCAALSSTKWTCTMSTGGNTNQIAFGSTRSYVVRGTINSSAVNATPGISIAALGSYGVAGDVTWSDGSNAQTWVNQASSDVKPATQPSFGAIAGTPDTTAPAMTAIAFANGTGAGSTTETIGPGDTITITWGEIIDPLSINAGLVPGGSAVTVATGVTGGFAFSTTGVITLLGIGTFDIISSTGTATPALTNSATLALNATSKILTVTIGGTVTSTFSSDPDATFSLNDGTSTVGVVNTTMTDTNGVAQAAVNVQTLMSGATTGATSFAGAF